MITLVRKHSKDSRVFGVGIGDGVSTSLLKGVAILQILLSADSDGIFEWLKKCSLPYFAVKPQNYGGRRRMRTGNSAIAEVIKLCALYLKHV